MKAFEIFTDSSCDMKQEMIDALDLRVLQLDVTIEDQPPKPNNQVDIKDFYGTAAQQKKRQNLCGQYGKF